MTWTTQLTSQQSPIFSSASSLRLALSAACFLYLCFAAAGFSFASITLYCRVLRTSPDNTMIDRKWATAENGGLGGYSGDITVYPQLAPMSHATASGASAFYYWPSRYGSQNNSPVVYTVQAMSALNIVIPDAHTNQVNNILNSIEHFFPTAANRAAISSLAVSFDTDGTPVISATTYNLGYKVAGTGVSTSDVSGNPIISYPDSTGFVPGYEPIGPDGAYVPVYYDGSQVSGGYALRLNSLESVSGNSTLSYDTDTGLYSFSSPDYSLQLNAIRSDLHTLVNKEIVLDNIRLELPPDFEINVPPSEVTVNPTVTVTPDVTVNVTAPTQNDITVAIDNSDVIQSIEGLQNETIDTIYGFFQDVGIGQDRVNDFDTSSETSTQEEQDMLNVVQGWQTQIPVISNVCDFALGSAFGNIPTIPPSDLVPITDIRLMGFNVVIDLTPYADMFRWFRAFCLMLEVIWFTNSIWRLSIQTLQV